MAFEGEVTVIIDKEGATQISVKGAPGKSCKILTADLEKALGETTTDVPTKELYERESEDAIRRRY